jgi:hypothetical protein
MAAGLGFKDFQTGEVLTAADVDGYLMQGIWVFANATARDAAVTSPQEGNFAFLKDTNTTTYYTGSAWTNLDTTGMVNPMTTTGDTIYSSSGSTPARLGIGSTGQVLTVAGGVPSWATPAGGGGMTLINTGGTTLTGAAVSISSIPATFVNLFLVIRNFLPANDGEYMRLRYNNDNGSNRYASFEIAAGANNQGFTATSMRIGQTQDNAQSEAITTALIYDYANTTTWKHAFVQMIENNSTTPANLNFLTWTSVYNQTTAINEINILCNSGNFTSGTAFLYGVK